MRPPPNVALRLKTADVAVVAPLLTATVDELSEGTHTGIFTNPPLAKFKVQAVTTPPPTVIVPAMLFPKTEGDVPQLVTVVVVPDEMRFPALSTQRIVVPDVDEIDNKASVGATAGDELTLS